MKIMKSLEDCGLLIKSVIENVENEIKEQNEMFVGMLAATLAGSLLGKVLAGKGVLRAGKGTIKAGQSF